MDSIRNNMPGFRAAITASVLVAVMPTMAMAHTGELAHSHGGIMAGLMHPVTGLDHLVALMLFGALLVGTSRKAQGLGFIAAGASLLVGFVAGMSLGMSGAMEWLITASAVVFAAALAFPGSLRGRMAAVLAAVLAAHGWAHGAEMIGSVAGFGAGFMAASVLLMLAGMLLGKGLQPLAPALRAVVAGTAATLLMLAAG
ncbi:MAG: HupE/UreJ family protein [Alcanivoracaceae bacterium]|nr:HupE/UreJ family protein [Alcanivoracaceae bacterium]